MVILWIVFESDLKWFFVCYLKEKQASYMVETTLNIFQRKLLLWKANLTLRSSIYVLKLKPFLFHPKTSIAYISTFLVRRFKAIAMVMVTGSTNSAKYDLIVQFNFRIETYLTIVITGQTIALFLWVCQSFFLNHHFLKSLFKLILCFARKSFLEIEKSLSTGYFSLKLAGFRTMILEIFETFGFLLMTYYCFVP